MLEARHKARCGARKFNTLDPNSEPYDQFARTQFSVLEELVGKIGQGTFIEPPFLPDYGCNMIIGRDCFMNFKYVT